MKNPFEIFLAVILFCGTSSIAGSQEVKQPVEHLSFHVTLGPQFQQPVSGRLLLFVRPGHGDNHVDMDMMSPAATFIAAKEVPFLAPGKTVDIDADDLVFPHPLSSAPVGDYEAQVVLDVDHNYNYSGRSPGDLESEVAALPAWNPREAPAPTMTLVQAVPQ